MPTWSGFWNYVYDDGRQPISKYQSGILRKLGTLMKGRNRTIANKLIHTLVNGNVGDTATGQYSRVAVQNTDDPYGSLGGKRGIETKTAINRATTTTDRDRILNAFDYRNSPSPWPIDKGGNGGGGKVGL